MGKTKRRPEKAAAGGKKKVARKATAPAAPAPGSNWARLKASLTATAKPKGSKHAATDLKAREAAAAAAPAAAAPVAPLAADACVALDCEMVGVGAGGKESVLARCSVVDGSGAVVYDKHVRVEERVSDFRTKFSGVRARDLKAADAVDFKRCQRDVADLLDGKLLVGHALHNDLKVLLLPHPARQTRDTARWPPLMRVNGRGKKRPRKLRDLAKEHLGLTIQEGEHGSVEDARAALALYAKFRSDWEQSLRGSS